MHYLVNNKKFYNVFAAFLYAAHNCPNEHVYFDVFDAEFNNYNWKEYPIASYETLFSIRARQIRNKFNKVGVAFSGGTDSVTVLKAFLDNNIKVDFVYIGYMKTADDNFLKEFYKPQIYIDWINQHWPAAYKNIDFIIKDLSAIERQRNHYASEDFVIDEKQTKNIKFSPPLYDDDLKLEFDTRYKDSWCLVTGNEIPHVTDNYSYFIDKTFPFILNKPYLEFFFMTPDFPEITIKQAHDLKKYNDLKINDYYIKKSMTGCSLDLHRQSAAEKTTLSAHNQLIGKTNFKNISPLSDFFKNSKIPYSKMFNSDENSVYVKNWAKGYAMLNTDKTLIDYMVKHGYLDNEYQPVQSYHGIRSKLRQLV